jgi:very-short-patch-repair endonuclease
MNSLRFRRQQPIGPYIADFYCASAKLIVELDGSQHGATDNYVYDLRRTHFMTARGLHVLRFNNHELIADCDAVIETIWRTIRERTPPRRVCDTSTLPQGEG